MSMLKSAQWAAFTMTGDHLPSTTLYGAKGSPLSSGRTSLILHTACALNPQNGGYKDPSKHHKHFYFHRQFSSELFLFFWLLIHTWHTCILIWIIWANKLHKSTFKKILFQAILQIITLTIKDKQLIFILLQDIADLCLLVYCLYSLYIMCPSVMCPSCLSVCCCE